MHAHSESNKYIQRLVRVLTEKEKVIDQLRKQGRGLTQTTAADGDAHSSIVEKQLRAELDSTSAEVKDLVLKMNSMQTRILELARGLTEQTKVNQQLQQEITQYQKKEKQFLKHAGELEIANSKYYLQNRQLSIKYQQEVIKTNMLETQLKRIQDRIKRMQSAQTQLEKTNKNIQKLEGFLDKIGQKIETIFKFATEDSFKQTNSPNHHTQKNQSYILHCLDRIEFVLKEQRCIREGELLNQTIDGLSIIMKSFEERLQEIHLDCHKNKANELNLDFKQTTPKKDTQNDIISFTKDNIQTTKLISTQSVSY